MRDDLESLGMMEHAFPKGPRGGPTRKRGQNLMDVTLHHLARWKPEAARVWARPGNSDDRQKYLAFEQPRPSDRIGRVGARSCAQLGARSCAQLAPTCTRRGDRRGKGTHCALRRLLRRRNARKGQENKVGPGVIAFLPKILNSLRWNLSELRENELIVLLKLAHIAITELDPAWLEESCIETTGVATYKQGGNRINKLKFIARNKSGKLKNRFIDRIDELRVPKEIRLSAIGACRPGATTAMPGRLPPSAAGDALKDGSLLAGLVAANRITADQPPSPPAA